MFVFVCMGGVGVGGAFNIKTIKGKGSFGHVQLVRDDDGNKTYALKTVSKTQVVTLGQQDHIMNEKRVMAKMDNPFLIKL